MLLAFLRSCNRYLDDFLYDFLGSLMMQVHETMNDGKKGKQGKQGKKGKKRKTKAPRFHYSTVMMKG